MISVITTERGAEEVQADEAVDCQVMELLRDEVLPHSQHVPHQFILRVVMLLNKGSIHSATTTSIGKLDSLRFNNLLKPCKNSKCIGNSRSEFMNYF